MRDAEELKRADVIISDAPTFLTLFAAHAKAL